MSDVRITEQPVATLTISFDGNTIEMRYPPAAGPRLAQALRDAANKLEFRATTPLQQAAQVKTLTVSPFLASAGPVYMKAVLTHEYKRRIANVKSRRGSFRKRHRRHRGKKP